MHKILIIGNGAGKTTSAIGKTIRFLGNRNSVYFRSFFKAPTSEGTILKELSQCYPKLLNYSTCGVLGFDKKEQFTAGIDELIKIFMTIELNYDVIVLDEILYMFEELKWDKEYILHFLNHTACDYLIVTGKKCPKWFKAQFDTISEIKNVKHIFDSTNQVIKGVDY